MALCVALTALWLTAVYGTYEESKREKYDVHITPGAVSYGTHSTATVPVVMTTTHHTSSVPMVSGNAVRSYAHYGHASAPVGTSSGKGLYTTSSASVKHIGSGGGASGGVSSLSGNQGNSSRGIRYGGGAVASVAMPVLAVNSSMLAAPVAAAEPSMPRAIGPRRVKPEGDGEDMEWRYGGDDPENPSDWWQYDEYEEDWIQVTEGDMRPANDGTGNFYKYSGGAWVYVDDHGNPIAPQPLGATPWLMMMLLACAYVLKLHYNKNNKKSK